MTLELWDTKELIKLTKDQPYRRVEGYTADLSYDPEKLQFKNLRINDVVSFGGEDYKVVDIKADEVVLSSLLSTKMIIKKFKKAP